MPIPKKKLGATGLEVSRLGFGCMRLPVIDGDHGKIDYPLATKMLRDAVDAGVNYVDTAYPYHGNDFPKAGESEPFVGRALADGYREKVVLATKMPVWIVDSRADMDRYLDEQLRRLDTKCIDVYLVHNLNAVTWPRVRDAGVFAFLDEAVRDGRIRHSGFSYHDSLPLFREILDSYDWPVVQLQYNYLDINYQAGAAGVELADRKGAGVAIMEPLRGGFLTWAVPESIQAEFRRLQPDWSLAEWGFRWLWRQAEVDTVLSGMTAPEQVEENLRLAATEREFGAAEEEAVGKVRRFFAERLRADCTGCGYCLPCPRDIPIPTVLEYYNEHGMSDDPTIVQRARNLYNMTVAPERRASECVACGECESRCPQHLPIPSLMKEADKALSF